MSARHWTQLPLEHSPVRGARIFIAGSLLLIRWIVVGIGPAELIVHHTFGLQLAGGNTFLDSGATRFGASCPIAQHPLVDWLNNRRVVSQSVVDEDARVPVFPHQNLNRGFTFQNIVDAFEIEIDVYLK